MPRSASMSISGEIISTGYPVRSLTTASRVSAIHPASAAGPAAEASNGVDPTAAVGGAAEDFAVFVICPSSSAGPAPTRYATICPRVFIVPITSGETWGRWGIFSSKADRISTRLIESMPRSASMSISSAIISTGYPVRSLTTPSMAASTLPFPLLPDAGAAGAALSGTVAGNEASVSDEIGDSTFSAGGGTSAVAGVSGRASTAVDWTEDRTVSPAGSGGLYEDVCSAPAARKEASARRWVLSIISWSVRLA